MPETRFFTNDMALVTFLALQAFSPCDVKRHGTEDQVYWFYERGERLEHALGEYARDCARVDPKQFMLQLGRVRREMHAVYDAV